MSTPLAFRCDLAPDESVPSWISRLAVCNRIPWAWDFYRDMGLPFQACIDGEPAVLAKLSALTGVSVSALERASIIREGSDFHFRGERLLRHQLRRWKTYVCPVCLRNDVECEAGEPAPYGRTLWQLAVFRRCATHGCALIPVAENRARGMHDFAWNLRGRHAEIKRWAEDAVTIPVSRLETYVARRLDGQPTGAAWLDELELHVAIGTCETLGVLLLRGAKASLRSTSQRDLHTAGDIGCEFASRGTEALRTALADIQRAHPVRKRATLTPSAVFGPLYRWLGFDQRKAAYEPVRDVLRQYIMDAMPVGPGDVVLGQAVQTRRLHSIATAARETGRNERRLRKMLVTAGLIDADHARLPSNLATFDAAQAQTFLAGETDSLRRRAVEKYLNAGPIQTALLVDLGFIKPHSVYKGGRGDQRSSFARRDLDAFLARLLRQAVPVEKTTPNLQPIVKAAKRARCSAAEILNLILDEKLAWVGQQKDVFGYHSVLVDVSEIRRHLYPAECQGISVDEARAAIGTSGEVVAALIREGHLTTKRVYYPILHRYFNMIEESSLKKFVATYVSITELARSKNVHHMNIVRALSNVPPAIHKSTCGTNYYRRDGLLNI